MEHSPLNGKLSGVFDKHYYPMGKGGSHQEVPKSDISTLNIGGMFGYISDKIAGTTLSKGLPAKYIEGYSSSSSNANVKINYSI